jgi:hypothetical protein
MHKSPDLRVSLAGLKKIKMKQKLIYDYVSEIVDLLVKKESSEDKMKNLPQETKEFTKGQLYEAQYILGHIEKIIFTD